MFVFLISHNITMIKYYVNIKIILHMPTTNDYYRSVQRHMVCSNTNIY